MFTIVLYIAAGLALSLSYTRDQKRTKMALRKAWKSFANLLPDFGAVLALVGIMLAFLSPDLIARYIGAESGVLGIVLTSLVGAVTLIPGFVAMPLAASLVERGAGLMQVAVFISTLMMVGIITLPLEISYFGRKAAFARNGLAYMWGFIVALAIGVILT